MWERGPVIVTSLVVAFCLSAATPGEEPKKETIPKTTVVKPVSRFEVTRNSAITKITNGEIPSISIAVFQGDRVIWEESLGWADKEDDVAASPQSV
jgi:hypothetical protein